MANTPKHGVRVADEVWNAAKTKAHQNGDTLAEVLKRALTAYVDAAPPASPEWGRQTRAEVAEAALVWARVVEDEAQAARLKTAAYELLRLE